MQTKQVSHEYISFIVDLLAQRVSHNYDYIIGIGRGGLIPATMLAYKLKKKVLNFGIETYGDKKQLSNHTIYQEPDFSKFIEPHNFLVVDDICEHGCNFLGIKKLI